MLKLSTTTAIAVIHCCGAFLLVITENIDKKAKTITLQTDYNFTEFEVHKYREHFYFDFIKNKNQSMGICLFMNRFNGRKYYPKQIKIENVDIEKKTINLSYS